MKKDFSTKNIKFSEIDFNPSRRRFIKSVGIGIASASTYSVISLSHFSCSSSLSPESDFTDSGYYDHDISG